MNLGHIARLEDFGKRSLVTHAIMALSFAGAIVAGLFVEGELGLVSFVALLNFTAGVWVAQSIHSLGHGSRGGEYNGILSEIVDFTDTKSSSGLDTGRLARLFTLIAAVTAVSLLTSAQVLVGPLFSIAVVAVGSVALVTAIVGFLIALGTSYDESMHHWETEVERQSGAPGDQK
ncbi:MULTISPECIES: hypothetical protein [Natrialbaceae]|uniref:hypothetical protein n=1 Tax=Natrialbaceae TaxID=1644061 RepID=UPI00207D0FC5|nr:hypothetical protein [Natronococcus sp. CG52]